MNPSPYYLVLDEDDRPIVYSTEGMTLAAHTTRESAEACAVYARDNNMGTGRLEVVPIWFTTEDPARKDTVQGKADAAMGIVDDRHPGTNF